MNQAITNNVTNLAVSTPTEIDLKELVSRNATKAVKGITKERLMLNNSKLMHACRLEYKSKRNMGTARLPDEVELALQKEVNDFITSNINRVHTGNALNVRVYPQLDFRNLCIVEKVVATGQNILKLDNQLQDCNRMIRVTNENIGKYEKQDGNGNSKKDYTELLKQARERLVKLELVKQHLQATIDEEKKRSTPAS